MSIFILMVLGITFSVLYSRWEDKKLWNKGNCPCGMSWTLIDSSDYGDLYVCPKCDHTITLTYKVRNAKSRQ